jgi:hypothetical protein
MVSNEQPIGPAEPGQKADQPEGKWNQFHGFGSIIPDLGTRVSGSSPYHYGAGIANGPL